MKEAETNNIRARSRLGSDSRPDVSILIPRLVLIGIVAVLMVFGTVMIYSASSVEAYSTYGDSMYFFKRQLALAAAGVAAAVVITRIPLSFWLKEYVAWGFWAVVVLVLGANLAMGFVGFGAKRWIAVGGFTFQPSEFAKISVMILCTFLLVKYRSGGYRSFWMFLLQFVGAVVCPAALVLIQPDLGTTIVIMVGVLATMWFGEVSRKMVGVILVAVVLVAVVAVTAKGFRSSRIEAWLDPWSDPLGNGYQIINSFYAFSNGGLFGVGLGNSTQKYLYLPFAYNDFIFAVVGEEFGLLGCVILIGLFFALLFVSFRIGNMASDMFGKIIANTSALLIVFQAYLNMACVIGVLPVTGKPLPFISYGGTSIVTTMMLVGFILAVSMQDTFDAPTKRRNSIKVYSGDR